jgi:hypothetical protein
MNATSRHHYGNSQSLILFVFVLSLELFKFRENVFTFIERGRGLVISAKSTTFCENDSLEVVG